MSTPPPSLELEAQHFEPVKIGPTWQRDPEHPSGWLLPERTLGWHIVAWQEGRFKLPNGSPWRYTPEQLRFLLWWYALEDDLSFSFFDGVLQRLKGWGKDPMAASISGTEFVGPCRPDLSGRTVLDPWGKEHPAGVSHPQAWVQIAATSREQPLALDTPVQTPNGWSTIGALKVGDEVFDSSGKATPVARATPVFLGEDCYRLRFDDGEEIVASGSHGWTVEQLRGHGDAYEVVTLRTDELQSHLATPAGRKRIRVPLVAVEGGPTSDLPVDPYLLGLWLGDGSTSDSAIAIDSRTSDEMAELIEGCLEPWETVAWSAQEGTNIGSFRIRRKPFVCPRGHDYSAPQDRFTTKQGHPGCIKCRRERRNCVDPKVATLRERLRTIGVLGNKHIPQQYAHSSYADRMELLRGLVDSDGWITRDGRAGFVNANETLFDEVCRLLTSLGYRWSVTRAHGTARRVHWLPRPGEPVAKLSHKADRHLATDSPRTRSRHRWLVSVERVPSVPVRCIGIDTDDHLFVAGSRGTLTHNTKNTMTLFPSLFTKACIAEFGIELHKEIIYAEHGARRIEAVTSSPKTMEGARATFVFRNETHHWLPNNDGHEMQAVIDRNATKSADGAARSLAGTNAYEPGEDSVAERDREAYESMVAGTSAHSRMLYDSIEAPPDAPLKVDLTDQEREQFKGIVDPVALEMAEKEARIVKTRHVVTAIVLAIRGDSVWLDPERIVNAILDPRNPPSRSRRFWYNQIVATEDAWLSPQESGSCVVKHDRPNAERELQPGDRICLGFDGSLSGDWTALVASRLSDGLVQCLRVWDPSEHLTVIDGTEDRSLDRQVVQDFIDFTFAAYDPVAFFGDYYPLESVVDHVRDEWGRKLRVKASTKHPAAFDMRSNQGDRAKRFTEGAMRFAQEVRLGDLRFASPEDPEKARQQAILMQHIANARNYPNKFGVSIWKGARVSEKKIDAAVCAVLARMAREAAIAAGVTASKRPPRVLSRVR